VSEYNGHVYMYCYSYTTWNTARDTCLSYGYDLVSINDNSENTSVVDQAALRATMSETRTPRKHPSKPKEKHVGADSPRSTAT
jgi:hypothetical protein